MPSIETQGRRCKVGKTEASWALLKSTGDTEDVQYGAGWDWNEMEGT